MKSIATFALEKLVLRAIEVYNRYRSPEAKAKLLKLEKDGFTYPYATFPLRALSVKVVACKTTLKTLSTNLEV